jgi:hypothetical protein
MTTPNGAPKMLGTIMQDVLTGRYASSRVGVRRKQGERDVSILVDGRTIAQESLDSPAMLQGHIAGLAHWIDWEVKQ